MPHLDTITYLTQYSWTLISLLVFYSAINWSILPKIQNSLRIRNILRGGKATPYQGVLINKAYIMLQHTLKD